MGKVCSAVKLINFIKRTALTYKHLMFSQQLSSCLVHYDWVLPQMLAMSG